MAVPSTALACSPSPADANRCRRSALRVHARLNCFRCSVRYMHVAFREDSAPVLGLELGPVRSIIGPDRTAMATRLLYYAVKPQTIHAAECIIIEATKRILRLQYANLFSRPCSPLHRVSGASEVSVVNLLAALSAGHLNCATPTCVNPMLETAEGSDRPVDSAFSGDTDDTSGGRPAVSSVRWPITSH